jgi:hypothetical protein
MQNRVLPCACHRDLAVIRPSRQKFVKVIVACPHRLPKLPESCRRYSYTQADLQTDTLFCIHCGQKPKCPSAQDTQVPKSPSAYTWLYTETRNTRPPVSNPIMWQFEKQNVPPNFFSWPYCGNLLCFSSYPHHSTIPQPNNFIRDCRIRLLGQKRLFALY